jgi:hypothetical protein
MIGATACPCMTFLGGPTHQLLRKSKPKMPFILFYRLSTAHSVVFLLFCFHAVAFHQRQLAYERSQPPPPQMPLPVTCMPLCAGPLASCSHRQSGGSRCLVHPRIAWHRRLFPVTFLMEIVSSSSSPTAPLFLSIRLALLSVDCHRRLDKAKPLPSDAPA